MLPSADEEGKLDNVWKLLWLVGPTWPEDQREVSGVQGIMIFSPTNDARFFVLLTIASLELWEHAFSPGA